MGKQLSTINQPAEYPQKLVTVSYGYVLPCRSCYNESMKHFAKLRNTRFDEGIRRLRRLQSFPLSRVFRQRFILQGVWTQCLHACESMKIGKTAWTKLRAAAAFGVGFRHTRNPFLALSMVTHKAIDPQFCAIFQSIQTCRNVGRFIPNHLDVMSLCLGAENGKYWSGLCFVTDRVKLVGFTLVTSRGNGKIVVFISFLRL